MCVARLFVQASAALSLSLSLSLQTDRQETCGCTRTHAATHLGPDDQANDEGEGKNDSGDEKAHAFVLPPHLILELARARLEPLALCGAHAKTQNKDWKHKKNPNHEGHVYVCVCVCARACACVCVCA